MNLKRMQHLEKLLRKIPDSRVNADGHRHRRFDMDHWFNIELGDTPLPEVVVDERGVCTVKSKAPECGTSACALGHAALDPKFRKQGLRVKVADNEGNVYYRGRTNCAAAAMFFGIPVGDAIDLFVPGNYYTDGDVTPKMVADRVAGLIEAHKAA